MVTHTGKGMTADQMRAFIWRRLKSGDHRVLKRLLEVHDSQTGYADADVQAVVQKAASLCANWTCRYLARHRVADGVGLAKALAAQLKRQFPKQKEG